MELHAKIKKIMILLYNGQAYFIIHEQFYERKYRKEGLQVDMTSRRKIPIATFNALKKNGIKPLL